MKRFYYTILSLLIAATFHLHSAEFSIAVVPSYAYYSKQFLKNYEDCTIFDYNVKFQDKLTFQTKGNFPGSVYLSFEGRIAIGDDILGFGVQSHSTGSTVGYKDYSGEIRTDLIDNTNILYLLYQKNFDLPSNLSFKVLVNYNMMFSSLKINEILRIGTDETINPYGIDDFSHAVTAGVELTKKYWNFDVGFRLSYMADMNSFIVPGYYDLDIKHSKKNCNRIKIQWGGFRAGLVVAYNFAEQNKSTSRE